MSRMTIMSKHTLASDQTWSTGVSCPGCGKEVANTNLAQMPKWRCTDKRCAFVHGWRLLPDQGRVYAVPVNAKHQLNRKGAVRWGPDLAVEQAASKNIPEEEKL